MLMLAHRAKEAILLGFVVRAASRTGSKGLAQCAKTADLASQKFHVNVAWRFVAKIDNRVS